MSDNASAAAKKKNNKKKKAKQQTDEKHDDSHPEIQSELDDGPWEEVKDTKKERFAARVSRKKAAEAAKLATDGGEDASAPAARHEDKSAASSSKKSGDAKKAASMKADSGKKQQSQQPKKQQKAASKPTAVKKPSNENELVTLIKSILEDTPQRYLHVPALGDRIQALTKISWNKTYKPQYGSLKDFVAGRSEFHVDPVLERVLLASDVKAQSKPAAQKSADSDSNHKGSKTPKKDKKSSKKAERDHSDSEDSQSGSDDHKSSFSVVRAASVLALLGALVAGTAFFISSQ